VMDSFLATTGALSAYGTPELDAKITAANTAADLDSRVSQQQAIIKQAYDDPYAAIICNSQDIFGLNGVDYAPRGDTKLYVKEMTVTQ